MMKNPIRPVFDFSKKILSKKNPADAGTDGRKSKMKLLATLTVAIVVIIVLIRMTATLQEKLFKKPGPGKGAAISFEEESIPVKAFKIKKIDFKDTLPCLGTIKGFKEIDLKFQVAGVIESFNFEEGEKVQEGDIIASLIQRDQLLKLKYAEIEANKSEKLLEIGSISPMKAEQSRLEYESAKSELDKTNIYAMSNGILGSRVIDAGTYVTPNDRVGVFVDTAKVYAEFNIIERDVPKVALGQKAEVFIDAYPNRSFSGVIDRIAPIIEGKSRTEVVKVELENKEELARPGMFTRALISTYEKKDVIVIPSSALKKKESEYLVYIIHKEEPAKEETKSREKTRRSIWPFGRKKGSKEGAAAEQQTKEKEAEFGTVEIRPIKLGYMTQDLVEVEEGLREDEIIIIEVQEDFKDKAKIEISEVQEGLI